MTDEQAATLDQIAADLREVVNQLKIANQIAMSADGQYLKPSQRIQELPSRQG